MLKSFEFFKGLSIILIIKKTHFFKKDFTKILYTVIKMYGYGKEM